MAEVSSHSDLGPELRQLAEAVLDRLDPALRAAVTMAGESLRGPGRCQQVWCPVCALAALASGEQHPMLNAIAEHSVALMAVVRAMVAEPPSGTESSEMSPPVDADATTAGEPAPPEAEEPAPPTADGRYHRINIVVEPTADETGAGAPTPGEP